MVSVTASSSITVTFHVIGTGRIDDQLMRDAAEPSRGGDEKKERERRVLGETRDNHDRSMVGDRLNVDGELGGALRLSRLG